MIRKAGTKRPGMFGELFCQLLHAGNDRDGKPSVMMEHGAHPSHVAGASLSQRTAYACAASFSMSNRHDLVIHPEVMVEALDGERCAFGFGPRIAETLDEPLAFAKACFL